MIYTPHPHQVIARDWLRRHDRAGCFLAPGLGKTVALLDHVDYLFSEGASKGVLIVAPLRVAKITWPKQIEQWDHSAWMRWVNLNTPGGMEAWNEGSAQVYITHFDTLITRKMRGKEYPGIIAKCFGKRKSVPVDTLILDESSAFKAHDSQRGKFLRAALPHFKRRYILTGTPAPNSYLDLQPQIRILDDGERLGRSFHQFRQAFFSSDFMGFRWELKPGAKEKIDAKLSDICLTLSAEDWLKVPPCTVNDIEVTLPAPAMKAYRKMEKDFLATVGDGEIMAPNAAAKAGKLLQMCSGAVYDEGRIVHELHDVKLKALKKLVKELNGEPLLLLVQYIHEADRIKQAIPEAVVFDEDQIPEWCKGKFKVWVASPRSMSHGLDEMQHGGRHVCWFTPTYSNETYIQSNARLVRQGQERETVIHRIIATDTIDEAVIEALRDKEDGQKGLMLALKNLRLLRK